MNFNFREFRVLEVRSKYSDFENKIFKISDYGITNCKFLNTELTL